MANTLFDSCSAIMYAGVYKGNSAEEATLFGIIPNSTTGDFKYTGSVGITGSSRVNSLLTIVTSSVGGNAIPKIDYSYTSESFEFVSGPSNYNINRPITSSLFTGTTIGNLILEGETNNRYVTPFEIDNNRGLNILSSSNSKFPSPGAHNVLTFQEDDSTGNHDMDLKWNAGDTPDNVVGKISLCVSGGIPFNDITIDKARVLFIDFRNTGVFTNLNESFEDSIINPSEFSNAKTNADSASLFIRTPYQTEVTDIGDGWLRVSYLGLINDIVDSTSLTRFKVYDTTGATDSSLLNSNQWPGSGSAAGSPTLTSGTPAFSIANLQLELIEGDITSSLSGSSATSNPMAFIPASSYTPTSESSVTKPAESLELPLTSSTVSSILTNHNQGTIITRFAWPPVKGSNEATSNHFALLKTGSASTTDFLRIDGRGIYYRNEAGNLDALSTDSAQVPYLTQSGSLSPSTFHNYAFTWSGSAMSCSIDSGSIITTSTNIWTGSAAEQLEYIGGVMGISNSTQVRLQYIMVSPHHFDADALQNATTGSIV